MSCVATSAASCGAHPDLPIRLGVTPGCARPSGSQLNAGHPVIKRAIVLAGDEADKADGLHSAATRQALHFPRARRRDASVERRSRAPRPPAQLPLPLPLVERPLRDLVRVPPGAASRIHSRSKPCCVASYTTPVPTAECDEPFPCPTGLASLEHVRAQLRSRRVAGDRHAAAQRLFNAFSAGCTTVSRLVRSIRRSGPSGRLRPWRLTRN